MPDRFTLLPTALPPAESNGLLVIIQGGNVVFQVNENSLRLPDASLLDLLLPKQQPFTFATLNDHPLVAVTVSSNFKLPPEFVAEPFNAMQNRIPVDLLSVSGIARQLLHWQMKSSFCSCCNGPLLQMADSWGKRCQSCNYEHFPHIHPCAIVLVRRDDKLLLIHKPEWSRGRYGLVAGFLDVGESLEECAIREAMEETGIRICNLRYMASQAWPFPSQVMVGFMADYAGGEIRVDGAEVDDADWFSINSLPELPASRSIARYMIDTACMQQTA